MTEWSNGNRIEGTFIHGKLNGRGVYAWANGDRYEGNFVGGKLEGLGVIFRADGTREESRFVNGRAIGTVLTTRSNGSTFERQAADKPSTNDPIPCTQVPPVYPLNARRNGIEGDLYVSALISDGVVKDITMLSGQKIFLDAVREAMAQYKCPTLKGSFSVVQEFHFKLDNNNPIPEVPVTSTVRPQ